MVPHKLTLIIPSSKNGIENVISDAGPSITLLPLHLLHGVVVFSPSIRDPSPLHLGHLTLH